MASGEIGKKTCPSCEWSGRLPSWIKCCPQCGAKFEGKNVVPDTDRELEHRIKGYVKDAIAEDRAERANAKEKAKTPAGGDDDDFSDWG